MLTWISIVSGFLSAGAWAAAAFVTPKVPDSYYGGPPLEVRRRYIAGMWLNAIGAFLAALSVGCSAINTWLSMPPSA